ncbi:MAG: DUF4062 domain-containing protein [Gemmatimonadota bacterium]|nr:DUF4062 domain-containing protein [Gemmatimonadota bacterium]
MIDHETAPRVMRVFISSTFRDMQADRDELVKHVFPGLRALCESRHVAWSEVDLRWGISSEQHAEGKVLPICLAEIEQCRPYFIGLLGERYGWIPDAIAPELVGEEPWLATQSGRSVTELEIVKGVLADPEMAEHAFFYFRDAAYIDRLNPDEQRVSREIATPEEIAALGQTVADANAAERRAKLIDLKNRIRASGLPVRESYADPHALGELVRQDLTELIKRRFPPIEAPARFQREHDEQEFFAASRREVYVARESVFAELDDFADGSGKPLLVIGGPGQGKSALLANWIARQRARRPDVLVMPHFVGATMTSTDVTSTMWRLTYELRTHCNLPIETPRTPDALRTMFADTLRLAAEHQRTVLIIDGVDALTDNGKIPDMEWLPRELPDGMRLIASVGPGPAVSALLPGKWRTLPLGGLTSDECRQLTIKYLGQFAKSLSSEQLERISRSWLNSNPLHLRLLLDELRVYGDHDTLTKRLEHYLTATNTATLYQLILKRYEQDYDVDRPGLVRAAMRYLWASRNGLAEAELLDVLGEGSLDTLKPLPQAQWAPLRYAMGTSLLNRGGRIVFSHRALRKAVEDRYLDREEWRRHIHSKLAEYFNGYGVNDRTSEELAWQICEAEQWDYLAKLLTLPKYLEPTWRDRSDDVRAYWARIESRSTIRMPAALAPLIETENPGTELSRIVVELLSHFGYLEEASALAGRMVAALTGDEDRLLLARTLSLQASIQRERGILGSAQATYERMESLARQLDDRDMLVIAMLGRATTMLDQGALDASDALFEETERLALDIGDPHAAAIAMGNRAIILQAKGDDAGALQLRDREEALLRAAHDELSLARALGNRAIILQHMKQFDAAAEAYEHAEEIFVKLGDRSAIATTAGNRAALAIDRGDDDAALPLCREQQRLAREAGFVPMLERALNVELAILKRRGDEEGQRRILGELRALFAGRKDQTAQLDAMQARGNLLFEEKDFVALVALSREHAKLARDIGDLHSLQGGLGNECVALRALGRFDEALMRAKEQTAVCREIGETDLVVHSLFARLPLLINDMQDYAQATLVAREALDIATRAGLDEYAERAAVLIVRLDPSAR